MMKEVYSRDRHLRRKKESGEYKKAGRRV